MENVVTGLLAQCLLLKLARSWFNTKIEVLNWNFSHSTLASLRGWRHKWIPPPDAPTARIHNSLTTSFLPSARRDIRGFWLGPTRPAQDICYQGCSDCTHTRPGWDGFHQGAMGADWPTRGTTNCCIYLPITVDHTSFLCVFVTLYWISLFSHPTP